MPDIPPSMFGQPQPSPLATVLIQGPAGNVEEELAPAAHAVPVSRALWAERDVEVQLGREIREQKGFAQHGQVPGLQQRPCYHGPTTLGQVSTQPLCPKPAGCPLWCSSQQLSPDPLPPYPVQLPQTRLVSWVSPSPVWPAVCRLRSTEGSSEA